jgi:SAM-dependent methyltransferase
MERDVYARMAELEQEHWWFVARRAILVETLTRLVDLPPAARVLEAGCGTGGNLAMLSRFGKVSAFEPSAQARRMARENGAFDVREGQLPDKIPFEPGGFDLVAALDVLEHVDEDLKSMRALWSQLRPGGWALITVPAFSFLWSAHDERHHHKRRYARDELVVRIRAAGLSPVFVTYFNSVLFPLIAGVRVVKKALRLTDVEDDKMPAQLVNRTLRAVFASERHLVGRLPLPFGVSLLVVARKAET